MNIDSFQISALLLMLVFYFSYFFKMIMQKRQGIETNQMGKNKIGFVKFVELSLKAITIIVPLAEAISIFLAAAPFNKVIRFIGIVLAFIGDVIFIISVVTMKDNWRAGISESEKTSLVTEGIYSISRNPAFLGFDLVYIGILLMFFNSILFIISLSAILMFHLQIVNVEEDFLLKSFGEDYLNYKKHVNRYLGRK